MDNQDRGLQASVDGFAHEHLVCGTLMKKYKNVSLVDLPLSSFDIIIVFSDEYNYETIVRAQVKTSKKSVSFKGGTRGGVDRVYKSGVKEYIQSPEKSDVIIALKPLDDMSYELYFIPTILVEIWKTGSKSLNLIAPLKNRYEMLEKCKDRQFVINKALELGIINQNQLESEA